MIFRTCALSLTRLRLPFACSAFLFLRICFFDAYRTWWCFGVCTFLSLAPFSFLSRALHLPAPFTWPGWGRKTARRSQPTPMALGRGH
ncbi:hypothetical protein HDK64DRAFT_21496 [Phyllosticta capitalensis]|uniref:Secreted protein n=1 Tax=Phyllosticta capitalensis TaxID=121624 RepID=A0ABR1YEH2_9PEZI